jgi:hypothetical protein
MRGFPACAASTLPHQGGQGRCELRCISVDRRMRIRADRVTDALIALIVIGVMTGRREATLVAEFPNGLRLSMSDRAAAWHALLPKAVSATSGDLAAST